MATFSHILIVDDDEQNLTSLENVLADLEQGIIKARSGAQALRYLEQAVFAVILIRHKLPDIDGFQLAEFARGNTKSRLTPIIFITDYDSNEKLIARGYGFGAVDFIFTPIIAEVLHGKVAVFIEMFAAQDNLLEKNRLLEIESHRELALRARKLEELNKELEASNRELDQFAHIASHDLREPLRTITNFIQLLLENNTEKLGPDAEKYAYFIVDGADRMKRLIQDLLEFSHVGRKDLVRKIISVGEIVERIRFSLSTDLQKSGGKIVFEGSCTLTANPSSFQQLLQNLISNALKFRGDEKPILTLTAVEQGNFWLFALKDNGIGINKEHQQIIFQIFQRLHKSEAYPGTGMGLAICEKIVHKHGGRIWVESEIDKGATFFFTIPR